MTPSGEVVVYAATSLAFVTRSSLTRAAILHAEINEAVSWSARLVARGRRRRGAVTSVQLGLTRGGGSAGDVPVVAELIAKRPLCFDCIVRKRERRSQTSRRPC
jgi:hypothetical protein